MLLLFSWKFKFLVQYICKIRKREVIDVKNRFGHCVSSNFVEELETELAFGALEESKLLPESLLHLPDLNTGVAFDNFDLFVETLTEKDTLRDTVGIVTQDIPPDGDNFLPLADSEDDECDIILETGKR